MTERVWETFIVWGNVHTFEDEAPDVHRYTFATEAELRAFRLGVEEMDGWLGYHEGSTREECLRNAGVEDEGDDDAVARG